MLYLHQGSVLREQTKNAKTSCQDFWPHRQHFWLRTRSVHFSFPLLRHMPGSHMHVCDHKTIKSV